MTPSLPTIADVRSGQSGLFTAPAPSPVPSSPTPPRPARAELVVRVRDTGGANDGEFAQRWRLACKTLLRRYRLKVADVREVKP